eukprot:TRINITY_DN8201_c0_g1_i1.p1 TRINITY_DN8201_c0_g1~~TRINITY_DN8201_c0_g1_i1.p1  ORF type:complete len:92 (-),score=6.08 TRINITY_DN8201_c0_g1_i1:37-312(-)
MDKFIVHDAELQVNLPHQIVTEVTERLKRGDDEININFWDSAKEEVFRLMNKDSLGGTREIVSAKSRQKCTYRFREEIVDFCSSSIKLVSN